MVVRLFKNRTSSLLQPASIEPVLPAWRAAAEEDEPSAEAKRDRWWHESSFDLRNGLDVDDDVARTLPGELIDQLFKR